MPAFRTYGDRVCTFHDLEDPEGSLAAVINENTVEVVDMATFVRDDDLRKLVVSLFNMAIGRHLGQKVWSLMKISKAVSFSGPRRASEDHYLDSTEEEGVAYA